MAITKRQRQVYDFLQEFIQRNGYSPSFEEIGDGLGLSSLATVHKHISNLEKKGLLKRDYNRSRSIDVLPVRGMLSGRRPETLRSHSWGASPPGSRLRPSRLQKQFPWAISPVPRMFSCFR